MFRAFRAPVIFASATVALIGLIGATTVLADPRIGDRIAGDLCAVGDASGMDLMSEVLCGLTRGSGNPGDLQTATLDQLPRGTAAYAPLQSTQTRAATARAAAPSVRGDVPASVLDPIPRGKTSYAPIAPAAPTTNAAPRAVPPGFACELAAFNPSAFKQPKTPFSVYGAGYNNCSVGLNMQSQACVFKEHHVLFVSYYRVTQCSAVKHDRRATFWPVSVRHTCARGTGTWRTVVFGAIFAVGRRQTGAVQSVKDVKLPCN
jgi:hypothetical protein